MTATKATINKSTKTAAPKKKIIALAQIAEELKINPKVARAKCRRAKMKQSADGWFFPITEKPKIAKFLRGKIAA